MTQQPTQLGDIPRGDRNLHGNIISNRPIIFWIATFAMIIAVVVLLRKVLLPFVAGAALAYLLHPIATRLERFGFNRLLSTLTIVAMIAIAIAILIVITIPRLVAEVSYFIESLPLYVRRMQTLATDPSRPWLSKMVGEGLEDTKRALDEFTSQMNIRLSTFLRSVWSGGEALISIVSLGVVAPVVACYLLYDWNRLLAVMDHWVPPARRDTVRALAVEVDDTVRGFVRGQGLLCLILAAFYASALLLIGLNHGALIGIVCGLLSFIPYLVAICGLVISLCVAIAQFFPDWTMVALVLAVFLIGELVADHVLAPYLLGQRAHLSPVWMLFALFAFGYLFGFLGLLIAGPLAAAIGVLMRFALRQYYASPLYGGSSRPPPCATPVGGAPETRGTTD
jgi:predicted PurR-regulated permease PerM